MKLDIGGGSNPKGGDYINLDIRPLPTVQIVDDSVYLKKVETESVDEIYSKDHLEHLPWDLIDVTLSNWNRVLKMGGKLFVQTCDFGIMLERYSRGLISKTEWMNTLYGHPGECREQNHQALFTLEWLKVDLVKAGFRIDESAHWPEPGTAPRMKFICTKIR